MKHRLVKTAFSFLLFFAVIFTSAVPAHAAPLSNGIVDPSELETFLDGVLAAQMSAEHVSGAVVAVVQDGELILSKGYGYSNWADQTPVSPQRTLFRIGSTSKLFVWTSVMQLVEQGKLDLDADVNTYIDFKIPATYPEPITMKNLMTHTTGFEEIMTGVFVYNEDQLSSLGDFLKTHIPARVFAPGEVGAYSNYAVALAGYIVERISGMPMYEYVEKNIMQPLGMTHATFRQPLPAELVADMSAGYNYINGEYQQGTFELIPAYPAGSVSATADDMAKFMIAHLQNGLYHDVRILSEATAKQMHSQAVSYSPLLTDGMAYGFFREMINGQLVIHHGGDTQFFHTGFYLLPEQNVGLFISTNSVGGGAAREIIFKTFMDHYYPAPISAQPVPPADMAARAAQYSGEFYTSRSNFSSMEKVFTLLSPATQASVDEDGYVLVSEGGETRQFVEIKPGLLQSREDPALQFAFQTNEQGVTHIAAPIPFSYIKAEWYEVQSLHLFLLGSSLLMLVIALFGWVGFFFKALFKREAHPWLSHLARISGIIFTLLYIVFLTCFVAAASDTIPVYQIPKFIFELPSVLPLALAITPILAVMGIFLLVFTALAWVKRFWSLKGRLQYTLVTISTWVVIFELAYWNLLKF